MKKSTIETMRGFQVLDDTELEFVNGGAGFGPYNSFNEYVLVQAGDYKSPPYNSSTGAGGGDKTKLIITCC